MQAWFLSLRLHARWWLGAFTPSGRRVAPLGPRRLVLLFLLFPAFLLLQTVHWLGFLIDEVLFRGYRQLVIRSPLFITGVPRSGTTFVHRTLASDAEQFTTFRTWEALFAPSIVERKILRGLARLDRRLGAPMQRAAAALSRRLTGEFAHIHEVGLEAPEEDYLALLPAGGCFILVLAFPASDWLWRLGRFPELPRAERQVMLDFYHAMLQKHLYVAGGERRLLSKNASFGSWLPELERRFPDARFLVCVREPTAALSSQISSVGAGLAHFGTEAATDTFTRGFRKNLAEVYHRLQMAQQRLGDDRLAVIDQGALRRDPVGVLGHALQMLHIHLSAALRRTLDDCGRQSVNRESGHRHQPQPSEPAFRELAAESGPVHRRMVTYGEGQTDARRC